ncbi:hypothetical protein AGMMS49941_13250 [Deferribacterales bacterium]|nr:hypothetical protein AGMMS49941_13250 [Deferribacterales bacterium]
MVRHEGVFTVIRIFGLKIKIISKTRQAQARVRELKKYIDDRSDEQYRNLANKLSNIVARWSIPVRLDHVSVSLADHCNYNCFACMTFSNIAKPKFADIEMVTRDLKKLAELTNKRLDFINLYGGEPLLHPNIVPFFKVAREMFVDSRITLTTNATLLLKQGLNFWTAVKEYNIDITPTRYSELNMLETEKYAASFGVELHYWDSDAPRESVYQPLDLKGGQNNLTSFTNCFQPNCTILREGRIYPCQPPALIHIFNEHFNQCLEVSKFDYLELDRVQDEREILEFISRPIPFCRYCKVWAHKRMGGHLLSQREIGEWT